MPLPPLPILVISGPSDVNFLYVFGKSRSTTVITGAVLPGTRSHWPLRHSFTSNGWPSSAGASCISGVSTSSFSTPRCPTQTSENFFAMPL